jgi:hypothetical protein
MAPHTIQVSRTREYRKRTIVYVDYELAAGVRNLTVGDDLENRRRMKERIKEYRRYVPAALEALGVGRDAPFHWSRKAGCKCGCSPGFVVDGYRGSVVHVGARKHGDQNSVANWS